MNWYITSIIELGTIAVILFLIAALFAPFESLGWWAGWSKRWPSPVSLPVEADPAAGHPGAPPSCYIVFFSGVGITNAENLTPKELRFLELLAQRLPGAAFIHDIFPYSAVNNPLTNQRLFGWFWAWAGRAMRRPATKQVFRLVALRNVLQVAVSADRRYGPVFNFGVARAVLLRLLRLGYHPDCRAPIVLMGLSGAGQVAVGSGAALHRLLSVPVWVVSIGGVLTSDPGILEIARVFQLSGSRDFTQYMGLALYPSCWPIFRQSAWNRALAQGKRTVIHVGPMRHMSRGDYFSRSALLPDGTPHVERTADVIAEIVTGLIASRSLQPSAGAPLE
jgi:hypothetical protein